MTSNPSITEEVRNFVSEKYKKFFPEKPAAQVVERRAECPINNIEDTHAVEEEVEKVIGPRVRVAKVKAIGVHTVGQVVCRRTGGAKLASLKIQPTGIISPVPYVAKTDVSVCTRKGNGLGNLGESSINYQATKAKYGQKELKVHLLNDVEYAASQMELATVQHHKDLNAAMELADKKAAKKERAVARAIKLEMNPKAVFTPVWPAPTGGEPTTPNRDTTPVERGPKINNKSVGKRKNRKGYTKGTMKSKAVTLVHITAKTPVEVRPTADEKAAARAVRVAEGERKASHYKEQRALGHSHKFAMLLWERKVATEKHMKKEKL